VRLVHEYLAPEAADELVDEPQSVG
jgi:hypothetical protein